VTGWVAVAIHGLHIACAAGLMFLSDGPSSPFNISFVFALLGTDVRWGAARCSATAILMVGVFLVPAGVESAHA
jgi:hypothetical protein